MKKYYYILKKVTEKIEFKASHTCCLNFKHFYWVL